MSLVASHQLADQVEEVLAVKHSIAHTHVHVEPFLPKENKLGENEK